MGSWTLAASNADCSRPPAWWWLHGCRAVSPGRDSQRDSYLPEIERRAHQVPFTAHVLPAPVIEPPESHPGLDLPKHRLHGTFPLAIQLAMARPVHDPPQFAFGQVTLFHPDDLSPIDVLVMTTGSRHRLQALVCPRPVGKMLVSKLENMAVGTSERVLVPLIAEAVQFTNLLAILPFPPRGAHRVTPRS